MVEGPEIFALSVLVAVGFGRIVTNPHLYADPTPLPVALATVERLADHGLRWQHPVLTYPRSTERPGP